jgi:hypothetical protein
MRYLVDSEEEVLVRSCADHVGGSQEWPGEDWCIPQQISACDLQRYHGKDDIFRQGFGTAELEDLAGIISGLVKTRSRCRNW